jgi:DNA oxidative demethylase
MDMRLFEDPPQPTQALAEQSYLLPGFALPYMTRLLRVLQDIERAAPFRHMVTRGGFTMSVAMTNCGDLGWTTDRRGYRYSPTDPQTGVHWPPMPDVFLTLARSAAQAAHFEAFCPDACLINRYAPQSRMSLHQDRNEQDLNAPIVSVSIGVPAIFLFGGHERQTKPTKHLLCHGDVAVWGGIDRLRYHGIMPIKTAHHPLLGEQRINLTFRKASL